MTMDVDFGRATATKFIALWRLVMLYPHNIYLQASSRLLVDYPEPQVSEILDFLFKVGRSVITSSAHFVFLHVHARSQISVLLWTS